MTNFRSATLATCAVVAMAAAAPALAATQTVEFNVLNASATLPTPFANGDTLILDTVVTQETGALTQSITFSVAAGITALTGGASWMVSTAAGPGPRLTGVNIDIFNANTNALVLSDTLNGVLGNFAISSFSGAITPGTYRMVATGTAVRDAVLDVSISMIPEPSTYALLLAGLGIVTFLARRTR